MPVFLPIIGVAAVLSLAAAGCLSAHKTSQEDKKDGGQRPTGGGDANPPPPSDTGSGRTDASTPTPSDASTTPPVTPPDAGGPSDAGGPPDAADGGNGGPQPPQPPSVSRFLNMDAKCDYPANLTYDPVINRLFATCGVRGEDRSTGFLFRSGELSERDTVWDEIEQINGYPSNHMKLDDSHYMVSHSVPDGFTIIDLDSSLAGAPLDFSTLTDSSGNPVEPPLNNPSGAVLLGGELLCVATSNLDYNTFTFYPGTILCVPYLNGAIDPSTATIYRTSGRNATGVALLDAAPQGDGTQRFAVLNSNNYTPAEGEDATLDIFSAPAMEHSTVNLGHITAQISPILAVTEGGLILIGVRPPLGNPEITAGLIGIDPDTGIVSFERDLPEVENFISSVTAYGDVAAVADFGLNERGRLLFINTVPQGFALTLETPLTGGSAGPSALGGDLLYQVLTKDMRASVSRLNLSALHRQ